MDNIIIVDDEVNITNSIRRAILSEDLNIHTFNDPLLALEFMKENQTSIIISDMRMPEMDGAEFLTRSIELQPLAKRIAVSGYADMEMTLRALNNGKIHKFLTKPWNNLALKLSVEECLKNKHLEEQVASLNKELIHLNSELKAMNDNLELKVEERTKKLRLAINTIKHDYHSIIRVIYNISNSCSFVDRSISRLVGELCKSLAQKIGLEKNSVEDSYVSGLLFQIGLVSLPIDILTKEYYKLTPSEKNIYMKHVECSTVCLTPASSLNNISSIIHHQYERFKGKGFPDNLVGTDIPIGSRILAVARDYVLISNGVMQKDILDKKKALQSIKLNSGIIYDPDVVRELQKIIISDLDNIFESDIKVIPITSLKDGMVIAKPIYSGGHIVVFPEGHIVTIDTIERLRKIQRASSVELKVYVKESKDERH